MILALTYWLSFFATYVSVMQSNILLLLCFKQSFMCGHKHNEDGWLLLLQRLLLRGGCCCLPEILRLGLPYFESVIRLWVEQYTPKAVVIDNHLPRQPLISSYVPDWPLPPRVYIPSESEMALRARIYAYNRHLSFDVAFICSTLTHCSVCHLSVWRLKWEVSFVHQSVWRWKWFFCQWNYVLQRLRLCRTSDTVFRREIDSRRQWGYGTCYGGSFPTAKECSRATAYTLCDWHRAKIPNSRDSVPESGYI